MVRCMHQSSATFDADFTALLSMKREVSEDVNAVAAGIIDEVRQRGDAALIDYTKKLDRLDLETVGIAISRDEIEAAAVSVDKRTIEALELAHGRIQSHHARQMPQDDFYEDPLGVGLGLRWTAVEAVGRYVLRGLASYPNRRRLPASSASSLPYLARTVN